MKCEQCEKPNPDLARLTEFDRDGLPEMLCDDCVSAERSAKEYVAANTTAKAHSVFRTSVCIPVGG